MTFFAAKMDCAKGIEMVQEKTKNNMVAINFTGAKLRAAIDFYKLRLSKKCKLLTSGFEPVSSKCLKLNYASAKANYTNTIQLNSVISGLFQE
ncbi:MAG: hypothetical protein ACO3EG_00615 [Chitinophagaceae bacterium]